MLIPTNLVIGSTFKGKVIGCAVYEYSHSYICVSEHHVYNRNGGAETLAHAMQALDPFQGPADYGYQNNQNLTLNFRANVISLLLKANGF